MYQSNDMPRLHEQNTGRRKLANPTAAPCNDRNNNNANDPQNATALITPGGTNAEHLTGPRHALSTPGPCGMLLLMRADLPWQPNTSMSYIAQVGSTYSMRCRCEAGQMHAKQTQHTCSSMCGNSLAAQRCPPRHPYCRLSAAGTAHSPRPPRSRHARAHPGPCPSCLCAGPRTPTNPPRRAAPAL